MRVLIVYAHPEPGSFCHAVLEQVERGCGGRQEAFPSNVEGKMGRGVVSVKNPAKPGARPPSSVPICNRHPSPRTDTTRHRGRGLPCNLLQEPSV